MNRRSIELSHGQANLQYQLCHFKILPPETNTPFKEVWLTENTSEIEGRIEESQQFHYRLEQIFDKP